MLLIGKEVKMFVLRSMRTRLALEIQGIKGRGKTMYSTIKKNFGFKGSRESVYQQFSEYIEKLAKEK